MSFSTDTDLAPPPTDMETSESEQAHGNRQELSPVVLQALQYAQELKVEQESKAIEESIPEPEINPLEGTFKLGALPLVVGFLRKYKIGEYLQGVIEQNIKEPQENASMLFSYLLCELFLKSGSDVVDYTQFNYGRAYKGILDNDINAESCSYAKLAKALEDLGHCDTEEIYEQLANRVLDEIGQPNSYMYPLSSYKNLFAINHIGNEPVKPIRNYNANEELNPLQYIIYDAPTGIAMSYKLAHKLKGSAHWEVQQYLSSYLSRAKRYNEKPKYLYCPVHEYTPKLCIQRRSAGIHMITRATSSYRMVNKITHMHLDDCVELTNYSASPTQEKTLGSWTNEIQPMVFIDEEMREVRIPHKALMTYSMKWAKRKESDAQNKARKELIKTIGELQEPCFTEVDCLKQTKRILKGLNLLSLVNGEDINKVIKEIDRDIDAAMLNATASDRLYFKPAVSKYVFLEPTVGYFTTLDIDIDKDEIWNQALRDSRHVILTTDINRHWDMNELHTVFESCNYLREMMTTIKNKTVFVKESFIASPEHIRGLTLLLNLCNLAFSTINYKMRTANMKQKLLEFPLKKRSKKYKRVAEKDGYIVCGMLIEYMEDFDEFALRTLTPSKGNLISVDPKIATILDMLGDGWRHYGYPDTYSLENF